MKSSAIIDAAKVCYKAMRPFYLWGAPGIGKSDVIKQLCKELGIALIDVRATLLDPVDLRGLPMIIGGNGSESAKWCPPDFLPKKTDFGGILFLDELNSAPQSTQAACYQLILDRQLGEYKLPDEWLVCAAGNRETDRAVTNRMPSPLSNRLVHIHFDVDNDTWVRWALANNIMTEIIAFLRFRPALLHVFDPSKNEKAFATPRTWQFVSDLLKQQPSKEVEFELIKGTIGEGAASELLAFLQIYRNLPNPDAVLMNPATAAVPNDPATLYALCGALSRKATEQSMERLVTYANRLPAEFSVLLMRDVINKDNKLLETRAYIAWASEHTEVIF